MTFIIISHQKNTLKYCNKVYEVINNKVILKCSMIKKKYLIIGGLGYIGSTLIPFLLNNKKFVYSLFGQFNLQAKN